MRNNNQHLTIIQGAVEGLIDEAVIKRLIGHIGANPGPVYGKRGKDYIKKHIRGFNNASKGGCWVVLVDLDTDFECAPDLRFNWLSSQEPKLCFRVAVREIETWLLADRDRCSQFLGIPKSKIPEAVEGIADPKQLLINLARKSRKLLIQSDMVPSTNSGRQVGPAYDSRLIEFVTDAQNGWRPDHAAKLSQSLEKCINCLKLLVTKP